MNKEITLEELNEMRKNESDKKRNEIEIIDQISDIIASLIEARVDSGFTQRDLAKLCGLKQSAIARLESLKAMPRIDTVATIAQHLGVKIKVEQVIKTKNILSTELVQAAIMCRPSRKYRSFTQSQAKSNDDESPENKNTASLEVLPA